MKKCWKGGTVVGHGARGSLCLYRADSIFTMRCTRQAFICSDYNLYYTVFMHRLWGENICSYPGVNFREWVEALLRVINHLCRSTTQFCYLESSSQQNTRSQDMLPVPTQLDVGKLEAGMQMFGLQRLSLTSLYLAFPNLNACLYSGTPDCPAFWGRCLPVCTSLHPSPLKNPCIRRVLRLGLAAGGSAQPWLGLVMVAKV